MAARGHHGHAAGRVLNAFRHHGLYRLRVRPHVPGEDRCSTPFGITDYIGRSYQEYMHIYHMCAQRLSASRIISACELGDLGHPQKRCSTPFGITDYIGPDLDRRRARMGGCSTPFGITDYIGAATVGVAVPVRMCSTPFGITDYIGREQIERLRRHAGVLNAFRHHGLYRT